MHIFHKWGKWKDIERGSYIDFTLLGHQYTVHYILLERECLECWIIKIKTIKRYAY